jgi:hypothetical protein
MRVSQSDRIKTHTEKVSAMRTLEMLLDYAILEGAELELPDFVRFLRLAQAELVRRTLSERAENEMVVMRGSADLEIKGQ